MIRNLLNARQSTFTSAGIAMYASKYGLQPADRIKEPIFQTGLSKHHSIYLGMDQYGQEWISENHWQHGVRLVKANEYFKEGNRYTVVPFEGTYQERISAVKRALAVLGRSYNLIFYNCESYANYVQTGKPESKQVLNALLFALLILFFGATVNNGGRNV